MKKDINKIEEFDSIMAKANAGYFDVTINGIPFAGYTRYVQNFTEHTSPREHIAAHLKEGKTATYAFGEKEQELKIETY